MPNTDELEAKTAQRDQAQTKKRRASMDILRNKRRSVLEVETTVEIDGEKEILTFVFQAVSSITWDQLISKHPPTKEQQAENMAYNPLTFGPDLMSKVCIEPELSIREWQEIWQSPEWSKGELQELFWTAVGLCNKGLDVNPIAAD